MDGFIINIEEATIKNNLFRKVVYTAKHSQVVLMSLLPKEEIGEEVHSVDQFFRFEKGQGRVVINGVRHEIVDGFAVVIPAGTKHNVINTSKTRALKLYTLYCPPHHKDQTVHQNKTEAEKDHEHFDGKTTE